MAERDHGGARQPRAGPQAGMGELVHEHEIVGADQRRDDADIGQIAGAEHAGGFGLLQAGEPRLELGEQRMIAGDQPRGAAADPVALQRRDRGRLDGRMLRQVEIIVAGERKQAAAVAQRPDSVQTGGLDERAAQTGALELGRAWRRRIRPANACLAWRFSAAGESAPASGWCRVLMLLRQPK